MVGIHPQDMKNNLAKATLEIRIYQHIKTKPLCPYGSFGCPSVVDRTLETNFVRIKRD